MLSGQESKISYDFIKSSSHFVAKEDVEADGANIHTVTKIQKKYKEGGSDERNNSYWYQINNSSVSPLYKSRLNRIIVATGELFRLLDNNLPKYRIVKNEDDISEEYPISKEVKHSKMSFQNSSNKYREGLGRGILGKWFYCDDDFNPGNALIDNNEYYYAIDNDRCFPFLTLKMHGLEYKTDPVLTAKDYKALPTCEDYKPRQWNFNYPEQRQEAKYIASNEAFLNEKHFATLKLILTVEIQNDILDAHVKDSLDKEAIVNFINQRHQELQKICADSKPFAEYLTKYRMDALYVIIYEINKFFVSNKHYSHLFNMTQTDLFDAGLQSVLSQLTEFLSLMKQPPLSAEEENHLKNFAKNIDTVESLSRVKNIYHSQKMYFHADSIWSTLLKDDFESLSSLIERGAAENFNYVFKLLRDKYKAYGNEDILPLFLKYMSLYHDEYLKTCLEQITNKKDKFCFFKELSNHEKGCLFVHVLSCGIADSSINDIANEFLRLDFSGPHAKYLTSSLLQLIFSHMDKEDIMPFLKTCLKNPTIHAADEDEEGVTPMLAAAKKENFNAVKYFIDTPALLDQYSDSQLGKVFDKLCDDEQDLALLLLQKRPHLELYSPGIVGRIISEKPKDKESCLELVRSVCESSNINVSFPDEGLPPLAWAAACQQKDVIMYILSNAKLLQQFSPKQIELSLLALWLVDKSLAILLLKLRPDCHIHIGTRFKEIGRLILELYRRGEKELAEMLLVKPNNVIHELLQEEKPDINLVKTIVENENFKENLKRIGAQVFFALQKKNYEIADYLINTPDFLKKMNKDDMLHCLLHLISIEKYQLANVLLRSRFDLISQCHFDDSYMSTLKMAAKEEKPNVETLKTLPCHIVKLKLDNESCGFIKIANLLADIQSIKVILEYSSSCDVGDLQAAFKLLFEHHVDHEYIALQLYKWNDVLASANNYNALYCFKDLIHSTGSPKEILNIFLIIDKMEKTHPIFTKKLSNETSKISFFKHKKSDDVNELRKIAKDKILELVKADSQLGFNSDIAKFLEIPTNSKESILGCSQAKEYKKYYPRMRG